MKSDRKRMSLVKMRWKAKKQVQ